MRIVHLITSLSMGGAQMMLCKLLSAMDRTRFDPVVVSLAGDGALSRRIAKLDVPVYQIGIRGALPTPAAVWRLVHVVKRARPDLIQGWQYHGNLAGSVVQAVLSARVPVLWNIRHSIAALSAEKRTTAAVVKLGARISRRAERVIYAARTSAVQHEALGYRADRRVILPNGFDVERFVPSEDARRQWRDALGVSSSTVLIGQVARYHAMKDHATFLEAAARLVRSHPGVHFVLAGQAVDRTNPALMAMVHRLNLTANTHLLGPRDDIHRVIAALDILTSASAYGEAFPNVVGEAMACGVPCVATDVGDSRLILAGLGRVVPPAEPRDMAEAWTSLVDVGREGRTKLGSMARRHVAGHYSLPSIVARYEQLYEHVAGVLDGAPRGAAPIPWRDPAR